MAVALCPGSYDPPTNGHIDVIERTARHFEGVIAAVIANPSKQAEFSVEERSQMLAAALGHVGNVQIAAFDGLLVDFARSRDVNIVIKGLRAVSDFEYELQMAQMNATLEPSLDTMFVCTKPEWAFLSSSLVKEVARFGGDVSRLVPPTVAETLRDRFAARG
ncbi:MAG: pantetheine-phosphate adenylyltransferase [Actinomycetota bacterium]|jgi:pantetheine-phosphate adenylyltransferase|nr:pantetheine-phosphate adenylyltransferase [Actinomycetota bacterium]